MYLALLAWTAMGVWVAQTGIGDAQDARTVVPESQETASELRQDAHDRRLNQQGRGDQYRIQGEPQPPIPDIPDHRPGGAARQDTGMADPSVNPGQAAGLRTIHGRIVKSDAESHVLRQDSGSDRILRVDANTEGDTDLKPGDTVTGVVTPEGRVVSIRKEAMEY